MDQKCMRNILQRVDKFVKSPVLVELCSEIQGSRGPKPKMTVSEILTILIYYMQCNKYKNLKQFYLDLQKTCRKMFPNLLSYGRFVNWLGRLGSIAYALAKLTCGTPTGVSFIDSTTLVVCKCSRIKRTKVFRDEAKVGWTWEGKFFGFKLHLVVNEYGDVLSFKITKGNVDDREPVMELCENIKGNLYADRGYISKNLAADLSENGTFIWTKLKKNMKYKLIPAIHQEMLNKRRHIETVIACHKQRHDISHTRHRGIKHFFTKTYMSLVAYNLRKRKPTIGVKSNDGHLAYA